MSERELSKAERKKARRKQRAASDRAGAQALDVLADAAVDEALQLVTRVADEGELGFSTEVSTLEAARYCLKRINDALRMDEWLDEVEVWVWNAHTSVRRPITPSGETHGIELRIEPRID
ncbi:MAG: hypothetical protein AAF081_01680 [Actinomycetota bacterium]